jgi:hypothetical protein
VQDAVDAVIGNLSEESGVPVALPTAQEGTAYLAVKARGENAPAVIYRAAPERDGWLILSLVSADEYKDILELQELLAEVPEARSLIEMTADALHPGMTQAEYPYRYPARWSPTSREATREQYERTRSRLAALGRIKDRHDKRTPMDTGGFVIVQDGSAERRTEGRPAEAEDEAHWGK